MNKLNELVSKCRCGVINLEINAHRGYYQSVEDYLKTHSTSSDNMAEIGEELIQKMIEHNTIIELQFYPDTPVGFYTVFHYDLDMAIDEAIEIAVRNQ